MGLMAEKILLRVAKGCLKPFDAHAEEALRERGYAMGDVLGAKLTKPRNPRYNALTHVLGKFLVENIVSDPPFSILTSHEALKRIQREGQIACKTIPILLEGQQVAYVIPKSFSFDIMDQVEFQQTFKAICDYVTLVYLPHLTPEQIQGMVGVMPNA